MPGPRWRRPRAGVIPNWAVALYGMLFCGGVPHCTLRHVSFPVLCRFPELCRLHPPPRRSRTAVYIASKPSLTMDCPLFANAVVPLCCPASLEALSLVSRGANQSVHLGAPGLRFRGDKLGPKDLNYLQKFKGVRSLKLMWVHDVGAWAAAQRPCPTLVPRLAVEPRALKQMRGAYTFPAACELLCLPLISQARGAAAAVKQARASSSACARLIACTHRCCLLMAARKPSMLAHPCMHRGSNLPCYPEFRLTQCEPCLHPATPTQPRAARHSPYASGTTLPGGAKSSLFPALKSRGGTR